MTEIPRLEILAQEVITIFEVKSPPVPIERMLQHPPPDMWEEVDIAKLSLGFLSVKERYSPRMSLTRLLARHIINSAWGTQQDIGTLISSDEDVYAFARMLIMPLDMIRALSANARASAILSSHFEVPEDDASQRLFEIATYL